MTYISIKNIFNQMTRRMRAMRCVGPGLMMLLASGLLLPGLSAMPVAHAASHVVTSTADSGPGSLRQAIADAAAGDSISFGVTGTITLTSGELLISKNLTISGPGAASLSISAGLTSRVLNNAAALSLADLTIANGTPGTDIGGAILNTGALRITRSVISGSHALQGGGIYNSGGTLTISDSTISGNRGDIGDGGGIFNNSLSQLTLANSTVTNNIAEQNAGGVASLGTATITNSTISGNQATAAGALLSGDSMQLNNVTITNNSARKLTNAVRVISGSLKIQNSILAANGAGMPDCVGTVTSGGHNLVGDGGGCGWALATGDQVGTTASSVDPKLGPLQSNGGPTLTQLPLAGSPAIDAGSPAAAGAAGACEPTDQRGLSRSAACDIGAVEAGATASVNVGTLAASASGPAALGQATTFTASGLIAGFSYIWDFGDGQTATGAQVSHTYAAAGTFTATVTATKGLTTRSATTLAKVTTPSPSPALLSRVYLPIVIR